jgi:hypothetical protein
MDEDLEDMSGYEKE